MLESFEFQLKYFWRSSKNVIFVCQYFQSSASCKRVTFQLLCLSLMANLKHASSYIILGTAKLESIQPQYQLQLSETKSVVFWQIGKAINSRLQCQRPHQISYLLIIYFNNELNSNARSLILEISQASTPRTKQNCIYIVRESDKIMKRIEQLKEGFPSNQSHAKQSEHNKQKWEQYLPAENVHNLRSYFNSISSKEDTKHDHYRQSLQNRLERLFREEKQLLKERHHDDHFSRSTISQQRKNSKKTNGNLDIQDRLLTSNSISKMQRKIKILEEKYKVLQLNQEQQNQKNYGNQIANSDNRKQQQSYIKEERDRSRSQVPHFHRQSTKNQRQWAQKEKELQIEVEHLKTSMVEIKRNNEYILRKFQHKQDKMRHKQRTKDILLNILHRLEFLNVEVANAKKLNDRNRGRDDSKQTKHNTSKLQRETVNLFAEFQVLKVQYKHLDQERKRVQLRQTELQSKLKKLGQEK